MRRLEECNPTVITVYFLAMIFVLMFSQNPVLLIIGAVGAFMYFILRSKESKFSSHMLYLALFAILTVINPLTSHNGMTVLFVINDSPITLEATVYGAVNAGIVVTVLYLFRSFGSIMTRDKLLYVFGKLSPRLALVLSMSLRYVTLFKNRARRISESQRALGLYKDENIIDKIKGDLRVFSILITWALENGITTADSMSARAYGKHKRTYYSIFGFSFYDATILGITVVCTALTLLGMATGALDFVFYPSIKLAAQTPVSVISYAAYGILAMLPTITETEEKLKWKYLQSRI